MISFCGMAARFGLQSYFLYEVHGTGGFDTTFVAFGIRTSKMGRFICLNRRNIQKKT